jgi:hypothetical protein
MKSATLRPTAATSTTQIRTKAAETIYLLMIVHRFDDMVCE